MLKFVSAYLALSYLAFAGLVVAGALQMLAAWRSLVGFALVNYRRQPAWGYVLGPLLVVVGYAWFFGTRREILTPGPAGAELLVLFGGAVLAAIVVTLAAASILRPYHPRGAEARSPTAGELVDLGQRFQGWVYVTQRERCAPAVCLLGDPASPGTLRPLIGRLVRQGFVVLVPIWRPDRQSYPAALPLVAWSLAYLRRQPYVDGERLALVGVNLGADLALRAALEERVVPPVVALAPEFEEQHAPAGLGALREMTYVEALRWRLRGRRRQLLHGLDSAQALLNLPAQGRLVIFGADDSAVTLGDVQALAQDPEIGASIRTVHEESHLSLAASPRAGAIVLGWLAESLRLGASIGRAADEGAEPATGVVP